MSWATNETVNQRVVASGSYGRQTAGTTPGSCGLQKLGEAYTESPTEITVHGKRASFVAKTHVADSIPVRHLINNLNGN